MFKPLYPCIFLSLIMFSFAHSTLAETINKPSEIAPVLEKSKLSSSPLLVSPFKAQYIVLRKSKKVGTAVRKLEKLNHNKFLYSYTTDTALFIFEDKRTEESIVTLSNNQVIPTHYKYNREGTGSDKFYEWSYDIASNIGKNIKENKTISIDFPENIQDSLSYHLQHRFNLIQHPEQKQFTYSVIKSSGSIRKYTYVYDSEEEIKLPYGVFKTIKLKREVVDKKRITYAWFAPELNYLMVRLQQIKDGTEQFEAQLKSLETQ